MPKRNTDFQSSFSVQKEIMDLKNQLSEKESQLLRIECEMSSSGPESTTSNSSISEAEEWQAKYERLAEAHKKLQKNNINLEEKLLKIVDKFEEEKSLYNRDLATQTQQVIEAKLTIQQMAKQNSQLKSDLSVALNILQMKPNSFVSQKLESLPEDLQVRVKMHQADKNEDKRGGRNGGHKITVAVPNGALDSDDAVSAAILARVLEERENERKKEQKFCIDIGTQTHKWQFPDATQLLKHSRARNILKDDVGLLEELLELSQVRKQLMAEKGLILDESEFPSDEDNEPGYSSSDILLASLLQHNSQFDFKKPKQKSTKDSDSIFGSELRPSEEGLSESASLASFDLLGSHSKLSNLCLEPQPVTENHYESITDLNNYQFYQSKQPNQLYSSHPSSVSSLFSLTQKASCSSSNPLQRSFSTSSYSAVQTDM